MIDVLRTFPGATRDRDGWAAKCPAHDDRRASLSIGTGADGRVLLHCHAHCTLEAILAAAHLAIADLFPTKTSTENGRAIVASYDYRDEHFELLYQVCRCEPKGFFQRAPDGSWSVKGIRRVLYRLPELQGRRTVFVTEGESDADKLWSLGLPATTNSGGAGKWCDEYTEQLTRAGVSNVVVLPDNDPPGETHGRHVARSCVDAKLTTKLIPLPGLPQKGDVSDFLQHHSKDDLLAIVKDAPVFDPQRLVTAAPLLALTSLADLLSEPDDQVDWLVEDRIPAGGVVLLVAAPKAGKSTLARELAAAVGCGHDWLGWRTSRGTVWLLIFQDKRSEVKKHFRRIGVTGAEPIRFFIDQAPTDLLPRLHELAEKERPALIVVDMLAGVLPVKDMNDYAQVTQHFAPLLKLSRASGASLLLLHHGSAHGEAREGLDAALGSTALSGSVDNVLVLRRVDGQRVLSTVQRIGPDLEPTIITLNPETGRLERAGTKRACDDAELGDRILMALRPEPEAVPESWIQEHVEGRNADKVRVLRHLLGMGKVRRQGAGGRKDPYRYILSTVVCSQKLGESAHFSEPREQELHPMNPDLFPAFEGSCSHVPYKSIWEQELSNVKNVLPRTPVRSSYSDDSGVLVPNHSQNPNNGTPKIANTPDKHGSGSCSQTCERGANVERF